MLPSYNIIATDEKIREVIIMRSKGKKEINITVGENIRKYRELSGYSREKFAELIGVSPRFVADVETGFVGISLTNLKKTCELLGISADRLLWNNENKLDLNEKVARVDAKFIPVIDEVVQKQLELIAMAIKEEADRKTRN